MDPSDAEAVPERQPHVPFRPLGRDETPSWAMPSSVPSGLRLELSRARLRPGTAERFGEWMSVLNSRSDEMQPALPAERSVFEATFRHEEADGSVWVYHLALLGEDGGGLDESLPIAADHAAYSREVKEPGWEELQPMFMLTPTHLRDAMTRWGRTGRA